ncbi:MAG: RNA methyltransferase [Neisseria sp.]|nr:RNA methyltransferase [Neisseria sp.]
MKYLSSAQNPHLKHLAGLLSSSKARRKHRQTVLEGVHLADAYLQSGGRPLLALIPEGKADKPEIRGLSARLPPDRTLSASSAALAKISALSDGEDIMLMIPLPEDGLPPLAGDCVALERVQDPGNLGAILRSAAAAGIREIVLSPDCADAWSPKVLRAAMGAHFLLNIHSRISLPEWCSRYGGPIWATALGGPDNTDLYRLNLAAPCAWLFGNEGAGLSGAVLRYASSAVKIPMAGATESLNVAMAATVCLFEQMRQRLYHSGLK